MMYRVSGAFVASIGAVMLLLVANAAFARSGATAHATFAPIHSQPMHPHSTRPPVAHAPRHHRGNGIDGFWPGWGDYSYGPVGEPEPDLSAPGSTEIRTTCTLDIPWDWVHRCPPAVAPSDRAYAPSCSSEAVTVPGRDGKESTINVTRCY
ncbi:MAG TPA: hypothetical protein VHB49_05020 [Bradyrhizobium sp.]|nr:hypothetical protein [Bradyrhizobium sp.]